jgi:hypothetical protein
MGSAAVVMVSGDGIANVYTLETDCCGTKLSLTVTVMLNVPALEGVPPNTPEELRLIPFGNPVALQL